jgi:hypothetical protein
VNTYTADKYILRQKIVILVMNVIFVLYIINVCINISLVSKE